MAWPFQVALPAPKSTSLFLPEDWAGGASVLPVCCTHHFAPVPVAEFSLFPFLTSLSIPL